ncbi:DUF1700 domain-containing protein [Salinibacterium sp. M195]|uniref:DUF1700 domain-containing protein n=1 Tax=Salinibacterium sp. M195 TaxID=2583374 RepID=UPI001C62C40B|nr:DUF1700 domain-containing protein [Salinibacterium sp. M195]QYH34764.1 hypothetical protein FFT87_01710 [Salinibacterium sp. M195]
MTDRTTEVVTNYLRELNDALHGLDDAVRRDIVDGAREELHGLTPAEAQQRIAALGDPAFIASEASDASPVTTARPAAESAREGTGYVVTASLLVALGGVIVPVLGWLAGLIMVWMSRQWWRWEKVVASLVAPVVSVLAIVLLLSSGSPERGEAVNPLVPTAFDVWWSGALLVIVANLGVGMWLLWRARRTPRPL